MRTTDPVQNSPPGDTLHEIAVILARGLLRRHQRHLREGISATSAGNIQISPAGSKKGLELSAKTRLSVQRG